MTSSRLPSNLRSTCLWQRPHPQPLPFAAINASVSVSPLSTAFRPIRAVTPLSTVFTFPHPGVPSRLFRSKSFLFSTDPQSEPHVFASKCAFLCLSFTSYDSPICRGHKSRLLSYSRTLCHELFDRARRFQSLAHSFCKIQGGAPYEISTRVPKRIRTTAFRIANGCLPLCPH